MKQRFICVSVLLCCVFMVMKAQQDVQALWVGQSFTCDLKNVSSMEHNNVEWTLDASAKDYLTIQPNGEKCVVKAKKYFSGTLSVLSSWVYIPFPDFPSNQENLSLTWYFSCKENPVSISPTNMTLEIGKTGQVNYSHQFTNEYSTPANARISYSCIPAGIVSVNGSGKVTAVKAGTAKVYVHSNLSNDNNAPYCTVVVIKPTVLIGDVNGDGIINVADLTELVDKLLNYDTAYYAAADMDQDGKITVADVAAIIDYLLSA